MGNLAHRPPGTPLGTSETESRIQIDMKLNRSDIIDLAIAQQEEELSESLSIAREALAKKLDCLLTDDDFRRYYKDLFVEDCKEDIEAAKKVAGQKKKGVGAPHIQLFVDVEKAELHSKFFAKAREIYRSRSIGAKHIWSELIPEGVSDRALYASGAKISITVTGRILSEDKTFSSDSTISISKYYDWDSVPDNNYDILDAALPELEAYAGILIAYEEYHRTGNRMKSQIVRSILDSSKEGKEVNSMLDTIRNEFRDRLVATADKKMKALK